jgi:hypothetical protein
MRRWGRAAQLLSPPAILQLFGAPNFSFFAPDTQQWSSHICECSQGRSALSLSNWFSRKFEHSNTFGLVTSASSNAVWARDDEIAGAARRTGAGRVFAGASEEVLCWDVKKGELLGRWRDASCGAQVSTIAQSKTDEDIFAVG